MKSTGKMKSTLHHSRPPAAPRRLPLRLALLLPLLLLLLPLWQLVRPQQQFSTAENRALTTLPALTWSDWLDGSFTTAFTDFVQDQFPFRRFWTGLATSLRLAAGSRDNGKVYFGQEHYLFLMTASAADQTSRQLQLNLQDLAEFAETTLPSVLPDASCSFLLAPAAATVLPELLPAYATQAETAQDLSQAAAPLAQLAPDLLQPDVTTALRQASSQYPADSDQRLYFRSDHHWTQSGAYVAYRAWAEAVGLQPREPAAYEVKTVTEQFLGTTYAKAQLFTQPGDALQVWYPTAAAFDLTELTITDQDGQAVRLYDDRKLDGDAYEYFLGGNYARLTIENPGADQQRTLILFKDSYANSMLPFLLPHYSRIIMVDLRYDRDSVRSLLQTEGAATTTDCLILYSYQQLQTDNFLYLLNR